ncbi:MAG TPA: DivIVA domain-containing protein [Symbiobacteriaceae bacterium]|nr:DivIVA domain-containing protein [Symbiobacteriaceae bacterium]
MALTPLDIHNKDFATQTFKGYKRDDVDEFLDQIVTEFDRMIKENDRLKTQIEDLTTKLEQYRTLEDTINRTLVVAQETAEEVKANAKKNADLIIQEARLQAERIIETGQVKARRIMEENADLARAAHVLRAQVKSLLQAQLEAIDGLYDPFAKAAVAQLPPENHKD